ncbi:hypothetical protein LOAG_00175 [Loa loa]|uniref:Uncharacterized protein n=1 Tax=Loa loa TaxID=7209 RepID=A0A1I7VLV6_LOALO|nr:hypothetical protein LOAG_00175 [Loa loa]EFO28318.1 hypothetical protein LOAG_00175 [Loa loa]
MNNESSSGKLTTESTSNGEQMTVKNETASAEIKKLEASAVTTSTRDSDREKQAEPEEDARTGVLLIPSVPSAGHDDDKKTIKKEEKQ